jgi:hypothetical protein
VSGDQIEKVVAPGVYIAPSEKGAAPAANTLALEAKSNENTTTLNRKDFIR